MAKTSRDPFSPPSSSMKKKGGGRKKVVGESAKADGSAGTTPKKKATISAKQTKKKNPPEFSDIKESPLINQRKAPPEGIVPSLVPHPRRNTVRSTRKGLPQPPAHVYIGDPFESTVGTIVPHLPPFDGNIQPLDHTSPHKYPPASFVAAAACAASSPANTLEDDNEEAFNDLEVGEGLDDLSYSSIEDNEDNMEKTAHQIEYSDRNSVSHGRRQTCFIPGGTWRRLWRNRSTKGSAKKSPMGYA